jgi:hypothetical protein
VQLISEQAAPEESWELEAMFFGVVPLILVAIDADQCSKDWDATCCGLGSGP